MHTKGMSRRDVVALLAALGTAACGNDRAAPSAGAPRSPAGRRGAPSSGTLSSSRGMSVSTPRPGRTST
jgi:ABC-type glycerol-3-phosphate transport system substrate-binding protein